MMFQFYLPISAALAKAYCAKNPFDAKANLDDKREKFYKKKIGSVIPTGAEIKTFVFCGVKILKGSYLF